MDLVEQDHNEQITSDKNLLSMDSDANDMCGEEPITPRIGNQYQVEIPPLLPESERLQLKKRTITFDVLHGGGHDLYASGFAPAIPIMWVYHVGDQVNNEPEECVSTTIGDVTGRPVDLMNNDRSSVNSKYSRISDYHMMHSQGSVYKGELLKETSDSGKEYDIPTSQGCGVMDSHMDVQFPRLHAWKDKGYHPLPDLPVVSWADAEMKSFLLGLYIFGKNLVLVKKFMESRSMGDILAYYYGKFYKSDAYGRWSECKKVKSRRCVYGQRIFTGWRQHELLSRISPCISKEVQDSLMEATKVFTEGRSSLEDFVFSLKATVGMQVLVEAIGIGEGKRDLTSMALDPAWTNQAISVRPEIPIGKACSSLTTVEIIKFLTGDFRLSKARSNDLFWEAVWPRLLARGWHSEQPKDLASVGSKHALVFLIPGIKKFSRRKLVKGNHYFDSVSDVLNNVASDPRLLDLEIDGDKKNSSTKDEPHSGLLDHQRHCYLRPKPSNCNSELMKFTVVDTSLVQGEAPFKVRELRSLPVEATSNCAPSIHSSYTTTDSSELPDSADVSVTDKSDADPGISDVKNLENTGRCMPDESLQSEPYDDTNADSKVGLPPNRHNADNKRVCLLDDKLSKKDLKCQFSRRSKSGQRNNLVPDAKRRKIRGCMHAETGKARLTSSRGQLKKEESRHRLDSRRGDDNANDEVGPSWGPILTNSFARVRPEEVVELISSGKDLSPSTADETRLSQENTEPPRTMIDLNLPQFPPDFESGEPASMEVTDSQDDLSSQDPLNPSETRQEHDNPEALGSSSVEPRNGQPILNQRRQSTRNRPPTARALEAVACGFLSTKRKERGAASSSSNLASRSSRRARKSAETWVPAPSTRLGSESTNIVDSNAGVAEDLRSSTSYGSIFHESNVLSERIGGESLSLPSSAQRLI